MDNCRFCEIINGDRKREEIIFESDEFMVITDRFRKTSVGSICLIIPKQHKRNILELTEFDGKQLISIIKLISKSMQVAYNCNGIRIWTAINKEAGQSIFHCHLHVLSCNSLKDRFIASFSGVYDLKRRFLRKKEFPESLNFELAERIRNQIKTIVE